VTSGEHRLRKFLRTVYATPELARGRSARAQDSSAG
jgi:hypothetical protein